MPALIRRRAQPEPWSGRVHAPHHVRALRASGVVLDPGKRADANTVTRYRQPWQEQALDFHDEVGELEFATKVLKNIAKKVGFFPATYLPDEDEPVPIEDGPDAKWGNAGRDALDRVGNAGTWGQLASSTMGAFMVPGECCLHGHDNGPDGWCLEVRSISEVGTYDGKIVIRDTPSTRGAAMSWRNSEPIGDTDFFARLWTPSDRWKMLAHSPVRAAITTALEALVLLSKEVSATASSRLASAGILLLPDSLSLLQGNGTAATSAEDDPFLASLIDAAVEAIKDPGSAAAAIPIIAKAAAADIKEARHLTFARPAEDNKDKREWALTRLATSLDLPSEMLTGIGDSTNHWSAFLLDDLKWRDHGEPRVQDIVHAWTAAYYRPYLIAAGMPPEVAARQVIWYDPTRAVIKSDKTQAAAEAHDRVEISGTAYRAHLGFGDDEAPDDKERLIRAALKGVLDPASALAVLLGKDPDEIMPTPTEPTPGQDEQPDDNGDPNEVGPPNGGELPQQDPGEKPAAVAASARIAIPIVPAPLAIATPRPTVTAAAASRADVVSRRLADIDRTLRGQIRQAAEDAVRRALERAGAALYSKARGRYADAAAAVRDVPKWTVPYHLGPALVAALGLDEQQTLEAELAALLLLWRRHVDAAQVQALQAAAGLLGVDVATALARLEPVFRVDREAGWAYLSDQLAARMQDALTRDATRDINTSSLVPTGIVRAALAIAGGYNRGTSAGIDSTGRPVDPSDPLGQIGTGRTIGDYLRAGGAEVVTYEWVHGFAANPFEPHVALDGTTFTDWSELGNPDPFPEFDGYFPGDHAGCTCDVIVTWSASEGDTGDS